MDEVFKEWLNDRPNYKPLRKWKTGLASPIIERYPTKENIMSGFMHRTVVGDPGNGKSTYCYKAMAKIDYMINGYTKVDEEEYSYKFALDNMIYYPDDLFNRMLKQKELRQPALVWCLDDASVHFGKQLFNQDRDTYDQLSGAIPTIRTAVTGLLITTPRVNLLAKPLREFFNKKVDIQLLSEFRSGRRIGKHYEKKYYPDDINYRMHLPFQDKFSCIIPEPFYKWYYDKKMDAEETYLKRALAKRKKKKDKENAILIKNGEPIDDMEI